MHDVIVLGFGVNLEASMFELPELDPQREKYAAREGTFALAGGSWNFTVGATRLGLRVNLLAVIGKQDYPAFDLASALEHEAEQAGFCSRVIRAKNQSSFALVAHHANGAREVLSFKGHVIDWPTDVISDLTQREGGHIRLVTSIRSEEWRYARAFFDQPNPVVARPLRVLSVNPWLLDEPAFHASYFKGVDYVFLNEHEAATLLGFEDGVFHNPHEINPAVFGEVFTSPDLRGVIVTCAQRGAVLIQWDQSASLAQLSKVVQDPFDVPGAVVDETGAGDAVIVGFLSALRAGYMPAECLASGVATASLKIRHKGGSSMPFAAEVSRVLNDRPKPDRVAAG